MKRILYSLLLGGLLWPLPGHAAAPDLSEWPGAFWLQLDALPMSAARPAPPAEAARLDAETAAILPTLNGQFNFTRSRALSSAGAASPTLHRYGPSLGLAYVLYDFGARALPD